MNERWVDARAGAVEEGEEEYPRGIGTRWVNPFERSSMV